MSLTTNKAAAAQTQDEELKNRTHVLIIDGKPATSTQYARVMLAQPKPASEADVQRALALYVPRPFSIER